MRFILVCLSLAVTAYASGDAPVISSDGADVMIEAGTDGKITLREPGASPPVDTTVGEMLATMTKMAADMATATDALNAANAKITSLEGDLASSNDIVTELKENLAANMEKIDAKIAIASTQLQDEVDSNFETFVEGQDKIKADIAANKVATAENSKKLANGFETVDKDIKTLADKVDSGGESTFQTCDPIVIKNSKLHPNVAKLKHIVGFATDLACEDGFFQDGPSQVTCFPSGKYCATEKFGVTSCDDQDLPTCSPCDDSTCKVCAEGANMCTLCKNKDKIPVLGGNCRDSYSSCKEMYDANKLKDGATEVQLLSRKPDGNKVSVKATCLVVGKQAHTHIKCIDFQNGRGCMNTNKVTDDNTCKKYGYEHVPFRSQKHYSAAFNHFGSSIMERFWKTPGAIYSGQGFIGDLTQCALNSESQCASEADLQSIDGKDWWFRNGKGIGAIGSLQPSGDYTEECYFGVHQPSPRMTSESFWQINDFDCKLYTGFYYMCGTKDY